MPLMADVLSALAGETVVDRALPGKHEANFVVVRNAPGENDGAVLRFGVEVQCYASGIERVGASAALSEMLERVAGKLDASPDIIVEDWTGDEDDQLTAALPAKEWVTATITVTSGS